ncbi:MAG: hypothetical protein MUC78_10500 [Bacteroidales bacterium]|nr:hypothetical protein [Bacteroidales bacterium]
MKIKMTLILATVLLFAGCDWLKDAAEVEFSTDLTAAISVLVTGEKSGNADANLLAVPFSKSHELKLADNDDIEPYLEKIRKIGLISFEGNVTGLVPGQTISTMSLDVTGVGTIATVTNITSTNSYFTPTVAADKLDDVAALLKKDRKVTLVVHGQASGPMTFVVTCIFDTKIVAGALD